MWKCFLYFYIILFGASGLLLGIVPSYVIIRSFYTREFYDPIQTSICFLYVPTIMIFIVAGIGFKAIRRKNYILMRCFSVSKVFIIVAEIIGSIWNFVSLQMLQETALPLFQDKFADIEKGNRNVIWDILQRKLKCCGIHGAFDYKTLNIVPLSCCEQTSSHQFPKFCVSVHPVGCLDALVADMSGMFAILAVLSAILALIQIPGVFISWFFASRIKQKKHSSKKKPYQELFLETSELPQIQGSLLQQTSA